MEEEVKLPLFAGILPDGLKFGSNYVVEFEPQSLWFETSLTLCVQALKMGVKTDYHVFTHPPEDVRSQLRRLGLDVAAFEEDDRFRIVDSYTVQTGMGAAQKVGKTTSLEWVDLKSLDMNDWNWGANAALRSDIPEVEKKRLHVDDNTSVLVQFNDEKSVVEHFRTHTLPFARHVQLAAVHSLAAGVFSDSFYRQFESFSDGIIDFKSVESEGDISHLMRLRHARGVGHDSSWKTLSLAPSGEVSMANAEKHKPGDLPEGERRLAAIMFTDTVGFTGLGQRNEELMLELLEDQRSLVRPIFSKHRGREVKTTGDGFLVEFTSSLDAVRCAAEMQSVLRDENMRRPEAGRMLVRVGIHLGDVVHAGLDLAGDAVNIASRIEPLAPPGGVCVTGQVYESVAGKVPYSFQSLGFPAMKNVSRPVEVYQLEGLGEMRGPITQVTKALPRERIAILPLANMSRDKEDEYFADGLTEELIAAVSKTRDLRVIARTSVMKYKGTGKSISEIGRELNVGSVLEGSVRKAGTRLRVTVQLVGTADEAASWSSDYDRELGDVFALQSDIAKNVADALRLHVVPGPAVKADVTTNPEAYVSYLKGRRALNLRTRGDLQEALKRFQDALNVDKKFARAYSGLADTYAMLASYATEYVPTTVAYPQALEATRHALELDPDLVEGHTSLGVIKLHYEWDWTGAEGQFNRAIEMNPGYAPAHQFFADYLKAMGRFDQAIAEVRKAEELDPLSPAISAAVGHVLYLARRYDQAIEQYKKTIDLNPTFMQAHIWFGRPYLEKEMYREAIEELETGVRLAGDGTVALAMLGHGLGSAGRESEAREILRKLEERSKAEYVPAYWMAVVYNGMKDREQVNAWLRRAFAERSSWLVWANVEPRFAWLKGDPDFSSLMKAMKFP